MTVKEAIRALGAMSGTSLDGVDAAVIETDGRRILGFGETGYRAYAPRERAAIRAALGPAPGEAASEAAAEVVETAHAELLSRFGEAEVVGFHGQTTWHDPARGVTVQIGNGQILAEVLDRPVVWDFRSTDVAMGGQGAPLAPFWHHACARFIEAEAPLAFLNLGGVGNLTWVDPRIEDPAAEGALLAFDTGPANAPIDDLVAARTGASHDTDGALAAQGRVADGVLEAMLARGYFAKIPPKSLDRAEFADLGEAVRGLSDADAVATLTACAAAAVAHGVEHCPSPPARVLVTGGGRRNPVLMAMLSAGLDCPVQPVEEVGLDGDMLEAQAFAYLAVRVMRGLPTSAPGTTGVAAPVGGGQISRPSGQV
ncbi:anhydro-N-acetylmuramic acid kinase [Ovoidimarina sediminis]|uniref:anhydro-N-acetylmuramic acid kinase n=1 Tax=Ovoidimarina sediminis TaxID=3079856 RepID=UPI002906E9B3|nr:anhydro-N-acetylmuramic acid kinase [Rhodophyticola sp. MJ-SS7]MDU8945680.1 anhydro-N-acetylmuramic acid kinase [Rhodophyticola sp. MJ-SS7]